MRREGTREVGKVEKAGMREDGGGGCQQRMKYAYPYNPDKGIAAVDLSITHHM